MYFYLMAINKANMSNSRTGQQKFTKVYFFKLQGVLQYHRTHEPSLWILAIKKDIIIHIIKQMGYL